MVFSKTVVPRKSGRLSREGSAREETGYYPVTPHYEIKESGEAFGLEIFTPGVKKDDLNLSVEGRELVLSANRTWEKPENWNTVWAETGPIEYRLHLTVPEGLEQDNVHAELKNGVLRLTLPKGKGAQRKKIAIE